MKTAQYSQAAGDGVRCLLCPHACLLKEGETGRCRVRTVSGGVLCAAGYGQVSSAHLDPIEKKPLYHFFPGSRIFSIGGWGCNFHCRFCQNWAISQQAVFAPSAAWTVDDVASRAASSGSIGVAYTYNEPLTGYEFVYDCAVAVRAAGLKNVLVTNGYVNAKPAAALLPYVDAVNLDIKSIEDSFYREICGGSLAPVQRFARQVVDAGVHLELTNLLIPGLNSDDRQMDALSGWIAATLGENVPLHITAYRPEFAMQLPPTGANDLRRAYERARRVLFSVYTGNLDMAAGCDTACHTCGTVLVSRAGWRATVENMNPDGCCRRCGTPSDLRV